MLLAERHGGAQRPSCNEAGGILLGAGFSLEAETNLVAEAANAGEDHGHVVLGRGSDGFLVAD